MWLPVVAVWLSVALCGSLRLSVALCGFLLLCGSHISKGALGEPRWFDHCLPRYPELGECVCAPLSVCVCLTERERENDAERETDRKTHTHADTHTHAGTHTHSTGKGTGIMKIYKTQCVLDGCV